MKFIVVESKLPENRNEASNIEVRGLTNIPAVVAISEKEALICLRFNDGKIDYSSFYGTDPAFIGWVKDLFMYFWEKARRV